MNAFKTRWRWILAGLLALALTGPALADAPPTELTRAFSGLWEQPDHENQGFVIQITETAEDGKVGVAFWFTFDEDLSPAWYMGIGPVVGNTVDAILYRADGVNFLGGSVEGNPNLEEIGSLLLSFRNCNQGTALYATDGDELGSGEVRIRRLSSIYRMRCSGGVSDDVPGGARPTKLELELEPADDDGEGEGKARYWERPGRVDLKVSVDDVQDGLYTLAVCGEARGDFEVSDGEGMIRFRSPAIPSRPLLDFDPRDCPFDVFLGETLVLTSGDRVLAPEDDDDDSSDDDASDDDASSDDDDSSDEDEIEVELDNTGVIPDAKGSASWEAEDDRTTFMVQVFDLPEGDYPIYVGNVEVAELTVNSDNPRNRSRIRFSDPQRPRDELLDFDPLGATIEIYAGEDVVLETLFPEP